MPVDAPASLVYLLDFLLFILFVVAVLIFVGYKLNKDAQGKMMSEIWEPSGYPVRRLVKWDVTGKTIEVEGCTYYLKQEMEDDEKDEITEKGGNVYPSRRFIGYGIWPFRMTVRIESWEKNNPEPIRPRVEKPEITSAELTAIKNEIQAVALGMDIQENEERQKQLTNAIANQPSKLIVYIMLGLNTLIGLIGVIVIMSNSGA